MGFSDCLRRIRCDFIHFKAIALRCVCHGCRNQNSVESFSEDRYVNSGSASVSRQESATQSQIYELPDKMAFTSDNQYL